MSNYCFKRDPRQLKQKDGKAASSKSATDSWFTARGAFFQTAANVYKHSIADRLIEKRPIKKYRIKLYDGKWTDWYYPGYNDVEHPDKIDKLPDDATEQEREMWKSLWNEKSYNAGRRRWTSFDDHKHEICFYPDDKPIEEITDCKTRPAQGEAWLTATGAKFLTPEAVYLHGISDILLDQRRIARYRIKPNPHMTSTWYTPGVDDTTGPVGILKMDNVTWSSASRAAGRRYWSFFANYNHEVCYYQRPASFDAVTTPKGSGLAKELLETKLKTKEEASKKKEAKASSAKAEKQKLDDKSDASSAGKQKKRSSGTSSKEGESGLKSSSTTEANKKANSGGLRKKASDAKDEKAIKDNKASKSQDAAKQDEEGADVLKPAAAVVSKSGAKPIVKSADAVAPDNKPAAEKSSDSAASKVADSDSERSESTDEKSNEDGSIMDSLNGLIEGGHDFITNLDLSNIDLAKTGQDLAKTGQSLLEDGQEFLSSKLNKTSQELYEDGQEFLSTSQEKLVKTGQQMLTAGQEFLATSQQQIDQQIDANPQLRHARKQAVEVLRPLRETAKKSLDEPGLWIVLLLIFLYWCCCRSCFACARGRKEARLRTRKGHAVSDKDSCCLCVSSCCVPSGSSSSSPAESDDQEPELEDHRMTMKEDKIQKSQSAREVVVSNGRGSTTVRRRQVEDDDTATI